MSSIPARPGAKPEIDQEIQAVLEDRLKTLEKMNAMVRTGHRS